MSGNGITSILGPATQLGFVVRDVEAAIAHWVNVLGVGPFLYLENGTGRPPSTSYHRGNPVTVDTRLAFGFMGDVQIELIEQVNDASSPYRDFLHQGREGLQHLGFWVNDHVEACRRVEKAGYQRDYEIPISGQLDPIVYYSSPALLGPMLELVPTVWRRSRAAVKAHLDGVNTPVSRFGTYGEFLVEAGVTFD